MVGLKGLTFNLESAGVHTLTCLNQEVVLMTVKWLELLVIQQILS